MPGKTTRAAKRIGMSIALIGAFIITIYVTEYVARLPESNCTSSPISSLWSSDHTYKATLLKKDCNLGETIFYSVRLDKPSTRTDREWFFVEEIEADPYPAETPPPEMKWDLHRLEIDTAAEMLSGAMERREGDLTLIRSYVSRAKPNS
jgi:hypothetical protein